MTEYVLYDCDWDKPPKREINQIMDCRWDSKLRSIYVSEDERLFDVEIECPTDVCACAQILNRVYTPW